MEENSVSPALLAIGAGATYLAYRFLSKNAYVPMRAATGHGLIRKQSFFDMWGRENEKRLARGGGPIGIKKLRTCAPGQIENMWRFGKRQHSLYVKRARTRTKKEIIADIRRSQRSLGVKQTGVGTLRNRSKQSLAGTLGSLTRQLNRNGCTRIETDPNIRGKWVCTS